MTIARLENLTKEYRTNQVKVRALDGVTLDIQEGDFLSIAGPSGSGKTTLLNLLGCLDRPTAGEVYVGDQRVSALKKNELADFRRCHLGFVFQTFNLIPVLSAFENVAFPLILLGMKDPEDRRKRVEAILSDVGLQDLMDRRPNDMSGGQQQRVAVARALVKEPVLVLADEPTANLDSKTAEDLLHLMRRMNEKRGTTFVFSTHDPLVVSYASRVVTLRDGTVVTDELKNSIADPGAHHTN